MTAIHGLAQSIYALHFYGRQPDSWWRECSQNDYVMQLLSDSRLTNSDAGQCSWFPAEDVAMEASMVLKVRRGPITEHNHQ